MVSILKNKNTRVIIPPEPKKRRIVHWALRRLHPKNFRPVKRPPRDESPIMWRTFGRVPRIEPSVHDLRGEDDFCCPTWPTDWSDTEN